MRKLLFILALTPWAALAQESTIGGSAINNGSGLQKNAFTTNSSGSVSNSAVAVNSTLGNGTVTFGGSTRTAGWQPFVDYSMPSNGMYFLFDGSPVADPTSAWGNLLINPIHDVGGPGGATLELQWSSHSYAFGMASGQGGGHIQFGIGQSDATHFYGGNYMYAQNLGLIGSTTNGHSIPFAWLCRGMNLDGSVTVQTYPFINSQVTQTNPATFSWELDIGPDLNTTGSTLGGPQASDGLWDIRNTTTNGLRFLWTVGQKVTAFLDGTFKASGTGYFTNGLNSLGGANVILGAANDFSSYDFLDSSHTIVIGNGVDGNFKVQVGGNAVFQVSSSGNNFLSGGLQVNSNLLSAWPATPNTRGACAVVNSNGFPFMLLSTNGTGGGSATWTGTNKLGW